MQKNFISSRAQNAILRLSFTAVMIIIMTFPTYSQLAPINPPINKGVQFFYANIPIGTHQLIYTLKTVNEKVSGRMMKQ
jgi:hypothetical protein